MKTRNDFVTNSSSSSFIIAKRKELTEEQKKKIIEIAEKKLFGKAIASTKEELDTFYKKEYCEDVNDEDFKESYHYENYKKALTAIEKGLTIYSDWICFECCEDDYANMYLEYWEELEKMDNSEFIGIDTDLGY